MKKALLSVLSLSLLILALSGVSYGWQGKMGGMGDPYGLVSDESDYLIHPAKITTGEGVRFYGDYRFTYTDVTDWDYNLDRFNTAGTLTEYYHFDTSGREQSHEALLGSAFPLGVGRMGVFFSYDGMRGDYDGDEDIEGTNNYAAHDLTRELDNFALRFLYGLPLGDFNLGGEVQFAYRSEENKNRQQANDQSATWLNYILNMGWLETNLLPFQIPYDSSYWEALLKGSLEGNIGPADVEFTLRGGFIFAGDNRLELAKEISSPGSTDMDGDVEGWHIGGDFWVRYPWADSLELPFLVRLDYKEKTRDGGAPGFGTKYYTYENGEKDLQIVVGGGVDKDLGANTRIAGGIYYNYLQGEKNVWMHEAMTSGLWTDWDSGDYPERTEHQVLVRFAGEREITPTVALRMGIGFFYGWVREDFVFTSRNSTYPGGIYTDDITLKGYHRGVGASAGGTFVFNSFTLEPFLNAGYQELDLDGDGNRAGAGTLPALWKMDTSRHEWFIGGGFSVLFDF